MSAKDDKYNRSEKGRRRNQRYEQTSWSLERHRRYNRSEKGLGRYARYEATDERQLSNWLGRAPMFFARDLYASGLSRPFQGNGLP